MQIHISLHTSINTNQITYFEEFKREKNEREKIYDDDDEESEKMIVSGEMLGTEKGD